VRRRKRIGRAGSIVYGSARQHRRIETALQSGDRGMPARRELCIVTRRGRPIGVLAPLSARLAADGAVHSLPNDGEGGSVCASPLEHVALFDESASVDAKMDSATWGRWDEMSEDDRAAMILADSLTRGSTHTGSVSTGSPRGGWGALAETP